MIVWGGTSSVGGDGNLDTGGRYDPVMDSWAATATTGAPDARYAHTAVWTGEEQMVIWGGTTLYKEFSTGSRYAAGFDADCDGCADAQDCAVLDSGSFAAPPEISGLRLGTDKATLTWDSAVSAAGSGTVYDVAAGSALVFPVGSGPGESCMASGVTAETTWDPTVPGSGSWYLVRGRNACGLGTYGNQSDGNGRVDMPCP
jgi:hypothetical protein